MHIPNISSTHTTGRAISHESPLIQNEDEITSPGSLEPSIWSQQSAPGTPRELPWKDAVPIQFYDSTKGAASTLSEFLDNDRHSSSSRRASSSSASSDSRRTPSTFRHTMPKSMYTRPKLVSLHSSDSKRSGSPESPRQLLDESPGEHRVKKGMPASWLGKGKADGGKPQIPSPTASPSSSFMTIPSHSHDNLNVHDLEDSVSPFTQSSEPTSYFALRTPHLPDARRFVRPALSDSAMRRLGVGLDTAKDRKTPSPPPNTSRAIKSLPPHIAREMETPQNKKPSSLQPRGSNEQKSTTVGSQTHAPTSRRPALWRRSVSSSPVVSQPVKVMTPLTGPSRSTLGPARRAPMKIEIDKPNPSSFLASEAQKIATPPITPRVFFHDDGSTTDVGKTPRLDYVRDEHPGKIDTREDWFRVKLPGVEHVKTNEWNVPEHLPSSPLCPRHPKHKSGGTGICPYHGSSFLGAV